jgi:ribosomal protein S18 acetylase RimI-like enzyme
LDARYAEQRDLTALAKIHVDTWRAAYRGMMPSAFLDALDESHALVRLEPVIAASPPRICVIEIDNEVVAFCRFGPSKESDVPPLTFEIFALNVEPSRWRSGVGRFLTERVLLEARSQGFETCTLWTLTDNARARRFYEAIGFGLDGATRTEAASSNHPLHEVRYRQFL